MEKEFKAPGCNEANELVAFLYGELSEVEAQSFQSHMRGCTSCRQELAGFTDIRRSVVAWRDESLGRLSSRATAPLMPFRDNKLTTPSAVAALREFFNLSPVWLKGAVAFATLVLCVLAGLAVTRWQDNQNGLAAIKQPRQESSTLAEQQLNVLVDQRVKDELERLKNSTTGSPATEIVSDSSVKRTASGRKTPRNLQLVTNSPAQRPLSKVEREQLAADLRLVAINNDSDLDLLDDRINQ